jgi:hypothetical protein
MQKRSRMPRDFNELAHKTLQIAIGEDVEPEPEPKKPKLSLAHQPSARRDYQPATLSVASPPTPGLELLGDRSAPGPPIMRGVVTEQRAAW